MASLNNARIGKDGKTYMGGSGGSGGSRPQSSAPSNSGGGGGGIWLVIMVVALILLFFNMRPGGDSTGSDPSTTVAQESPDSYVEEDSSASSSSTPLSRSDVDEWVTVEGIIRRDEQTTAETGMGWSRVVYYLELDRRTTITYVNGFGDVCQADVDWIAFEVLEQSGDDADKNLNSVYDMRWDDLIGYHATVTGQPIDTGNAHTVGPVMLTNSWATES